MYATPSLSAPPRPQLNQRSEYRSTHPVESFIVPLLKRQIEGLLDVHARPLGSGGMALDVGCGRQPFRAMLEGFGFTYYGLDTQPAGDGSVAFIAAIDGPLPPEVGQVGPFHFVLCTEVLEHVADWPAAFGNLARLTLPGGAVLVTCPHYYVLHEEPYDFWRPTLHAVRYHAERAGFRVVHAEASGTPWDVFGTWLGGVVPRPAGRSVTDRMLARLVSAARRIVLAALRQGWIQRRVAMHGKTYLSNVVVLRRE